MEIQVAFTGHLVDLDKQGLDLSTEELEEFGEELEIALESIFRTSPFTTYDHNEIQLVQIEATVEAAETKGRDDPRTSTAELETSKLE